MAIRAKEVKTIVNEVAKFKKDEIEFLFELIKKYIKNNKTYVILTKNDGVIYKRVSLDDDGKINLISDNIIYKPYSVSLNEIIEIWEAIGFYSHDLPKPNETIHSLKSVVENIQSDIDSIKNKIS